MAGNIKTTLGADLQALTDQQVFRFPSTFTFIFRAFASIDGIGKGLYTDFDLAKVPHVLSLTIGRVSRHALGARLMGVRSVASRAVGPAIHRGADRGRRADE